MEFTCDRGALYETISIVQSIIPARTMHPILSNVLFSAQKNKVSIIGTDLDITIIGTIEASVKSVGSLGVPAKKFTDLLREFGSGEVLFKKDKEKVNLIQGKGKYVVSGVSGEDFPKEDILKEELASFGISSTILKRLFHMTSYAISADIARIALTGLLVQFMDKEVRAVATDGHRLSLLKYGIEVSGSSGQKMLIPQKTVNNLVKLLGDDEKNVRITLGRTSAKFEIGNFVLISKLISESFPDYSQVIPKDNNKSVILNREILLSTIRRASILSNPLTHLIKFNLASGKLALSCSDYDVGGEAYEEMTADYEDEPLAIGFNSNYMVELLKHLESDEVKILIKNPLSAALVLPIPQIEKEEYLSILMPLRLPEEEV